MKLYGLKHAPNPRRVKIFLAEKKIAIPLEELDIETGQHKTPGFLAKNSLGQLPVLELDDGTTGAGSREGAIDRPDGARLRFGRLVWPGGAGQDPG